MARTYKQDCVLAYALDLLGERWTLLIIRNLFLGPQRFGDLQAGLPGIGANLLSKRLRELDEAALIAAPGPTETRGQYKLTAQGEALRPTIRSLMRWSIPYFIGRPDPTPVRDYIKSNDQNPDSIALAIEIFAGDRPEPELNYVAHVFIDDFPYTLYYMNGEMTARRGADAPAVAALSAEVSTIMQMFRKDIALEDAKAKMSISGDEKAITHLLACIAGIREKTDDC